MIIDMSKEVSETNKRIEQYREDYKEYLRKQRPYDIILKISLLFFLTSLFSSLIFLFKIW